MSRAIREWLGETVEVTKGGVVLQLVGWGIVATASVVGVIQVERLSDRQLDDLARALAAIEYETEVREYAACAQAVEGRAALRETMIDLYDGVALLDGETIDAFAAAQRALLDERRPSLSLADDCPQPPEPRNLIDGDD